MSRADPGLPAMRDEVRLLVEEGRRADRAARREEARSCYERALRSLGSHDEAPGAACLLRWIGRTHADGGDTGAALDCFEAALAVAEAAGNGVDVANAVNCQASVAFGHGKLDEAESLWRETLKTARVHGERQLLAMVEQNLGNVASIQGDLDVAVTRYRSALHEYRRLGLEEYVGPLLNNLGMTLTDLGRWSEAEDAFREGSRICRSQGAVSVRVVLQVSWARLHVERQDWERARARCDAAQELALEAGDFRWLGEIFRYYGAVFRELGRPHLARDYLDRARSLAREHGNLLLEAETAREEAELHWSRDENQETLRALNRAHRLFDELRARHRLADVDRRLRSLEEDFLRIVQAWGESLESKDTYTQGHCERVAEYACRLARAAGFPEGYLVWFRMGALLHDIGKVAIPLEILNKPGGLGDEEWRVMKTHPDEGVRLLGDLEFPWDVRPMIRGHHERWDGSGYPRGLAGEEIHRSARILCIADVYDALTTDRSYRNAYSPEEALEILRDESGSSFDPDLVDIFVDLVAEDASSEMDEGESPPAGGRRRGDIAPASTERVSPTPAGAVA